LGFFEGKWETINGRPPSAWDFAGTPFFKMPFLRETRDGRHVIALDFYPKLRARTLNFLRCSESSESIDNAILQWRADELETAAAEQGLVVGKVRFIRRSANPGVMSPLITEKLWKILAPQYYLQSGHAGLYPAVLRIPVLST